MVFAGTPASLRFDAMAPTGERPTTNSATGIGANSACHRLVTPPAVPNVLLPSPVPEYGWNRTYPASGKFVLLPKYQVVSRGTCRPEPAMVPTPPLAGKLLRRHCWALNMAQMEKP